MSMGTELSALPGRSVKSMQWRWGGDQIPHKAEICNRRTVLEQLGKIRLTYVCFNECSGSIDAAKLEKNSFQVTHAGEAQWLKVWFLWIISCFTILFHDHEWEMIIYTCKCEQLYIEIPSRPCFVWFFFFLFHWVHKDLWVDTRQHVNAHDAGKHLCGTVCKSRCTTINPA